MRKKFTDQISWAIIFPKYSRVTRSEDIEKIRAAEIWRRRQKWNRKPDKQKRRIWIQKLPRKKVWKSSISTYRQILVSI